MPQIEILAEAELEAAEAIAWYAVRSVDTPPAFVRELDYAFEQIISTPERWPVYLRESRRYRMRRFPFYVVYLATTDRARVIAVAHTSRSPGYWLERLK